MCVCVCVCVNIYIYTHTHIVYPQTHICMCMYIHVHIYMYACIYIHIYSREGGRAEPLPTSLVSSSGSLYTILPLPILYSARQRKGRSGGDGLILRNCRATGVQ